MTLVARKPLPGFDATLVERLVAHTREIGVDVRLDTEVIGVERIQAGGSFRVTCRKDGTTSSVDAARCASRKISASIRPLPLAITAPIHAWSDVRSPTAPLSTAVSSPWEKLKEPMGNPGDSQASTR